jgi:hypothetical protein
MGIQGVGAGYGHVGKTQGNQAADSWANFGNTAFNALVGAGSVAAGVFGGSSASSAVDSLRGLAGGGGGAVSGANGFGDEVGNITGQITDVANSNVAQAGQDALNNSSDQVAMIKLQQAVNMQSMSINMMSNMQKAQHDARMASVNNMR